MKKRILFWLIMLPFSSNAQGNAAEKPAGLTRHPTSDQTPDRACVCRHLNTAILFPKPPEFLALTSTPIIESTFTIQACIKNLKSIDGLRLTLNGEEQPMRQQASSIDKEAFCPNGYFFSYTLTESAAHNTISLEARNEGGATLRYLDVSATK